MTNCNKVWQRPWLGGRLVGSSRSRTEWRRRQLQGWCRDHRHEYSAWRRTWCCQEHCSRWLIANTQQNISITVFIIIIIIIPGLHPQCIMPLVASSLRSHVDCCSHRVTTRQTLWNSLTISWRFAALFRNTRHVKCYSYHASTSVIVSGVGYECNTAWSQTKMKCTNSAKSSK